MAVFFAIRTVCEALPHEAQAPFPDESTGSPSPEPAPSHPWHPPAPRSAPTPSAPPTTALHRPRSALRWPQGHSRLETQKREHKNTHNVSNAILY